MKITIKEKLDKKSRPKAIVEMEVDDLLVLLTTAERTMSADIRATDSDHIAEILQEVKDNLSRTINWVESKTRLPEHPEVSENFIF
jgi:hypothetical protein